MNDSTTLKLYNELIDYDPISGELTWKERSSKHFSPDTPPSMVKSWNTRNAGKPALASCVRGVMRGKINGKQHFAHRVAFAIHNGYIPDVVEHKDGNPRNNKIDNLVEVSQSSVAVMREKRIRAKKAVADYGIFTTLNNVTTLRVKYDGVISEASCVGDDKDFLRKAIEDMLVDRM